MSLAPATAPGAEVERYRAAFAARDGARREPGRLAALRRAAIARFTETGFPSPKSEAWKFTNPAPLAGGVFAEAPEVAVTAAQVEPFLYPGCAALVFVNGRFAPALSRAGGLPDALLAGSLREAIAEQPARLAELGAHVDTVGQPLSALNTALFEDGALVWVPKGLAVESPIQLLYLAAGGAQRSAPFVVFPRTLVVAGEASQLTLIESYAALGDAAYWTCAATEIVAGENANVDHYKSQRESLRALHTAAQETVLQRGAQVSSHAFSLGAALARHDVHGLLAGEGADANLNGLYMVRGDQHCDTHMKVDHRAAHCASHELYKGVLDGRARAVFDGLIHVHRGAQKTDAKQTNRNLLLSRDALVNTNPQLLIFADDVKCTHGSTVGELDQDAVFYLRSRGIGVEAATSLLTYAFAHDVVERIRVESLRQDLESFLFAWLPKGDVVAQAV
jgi:Fe-S cluster assembly protein SufD